MGSNEFHRSAGGESRCARRSRTFRLAPAFRSRPFRASSIARNTSPTRTRVKRRGSDRGAQLPARAPPLGCLAGKRSLPDRADLRQSQPPLHPPDPDRHLGALHRERRAPAGPAQRRGLADAGGRDVGGLIDQTQVDGVILSSPVTDNVRRRSRSWTGGACPYVRISPGTDHGAQPRRCSMDDVQAADDMTGHLINAGPSSGSASSSVTSITRPATCGSTAIAARWTARGCLTSRAMCARASSTSPAGEAAADAHAGLADPADGDLRQQ
jgi:hypothetical protein